MFTFPRYTLSIAITAVIAVVYGLDQSAFFSMSYVRHQAEAGSWWQLISGQLIHLNHWHLLLNLINYWALVLVFRRCLTIKYEAFGLYCCLMGVGLGIHFVSSDLLWYCGFSGVVHGMLVYSALLSFWHSDCRLSLVIVAVLLAKITLEQMGHSSHGFVEQLIGNDVAVDSHFYGLLSGCLAAWLIYNNQGQSNISSKGGGFIFVEH